MATVRFPVYSRMHVYVLQFQYYTNESEREGEARASHTDQAKRTGGGAIRAGHTDQGKP